MITTEGEPMKRLHVTLLAAGLLIPLCASAQIRIGLVATTSGPLAALGQEQNDGFLLALEQRNGMLGGQKVELFREDDQLKPEVGVQVVQKLIQKERVTVVVGVTGSNVINAVYPRIVDSGVVFLGTNGGPAPFAGERCSPLFVSTAFQNDGGHEAMGKYAQERGLKRVLVMAPNYQAGKDAIAGFKRFYKGTVVEELYPALGQQDFAAEFAQVRGAKPDAVFAFMPGSMGINFIKQYRQAGLSQDVRLISAFTVDELSLPAVQDAALGMITATHWTSAIDNPRTRKFVADFEARYKRTPSMYAAQGYDAAVLLDQGIARAGASWNKPAELAKALRAGRFNSVRGDITFGANGFPIQDFSAWKVVKDKDGRLTFELEETVLKAHQDVYVEKCKN
jgi:branched-chain amino acid transport system substrate-binding protein